MTVTSLTEYRQKQAEELLAQRQAERHVVGYKLVGKKHKVVACYDVHEWAKWFGKADRAVGRTTIGPFNIKTSFLAVDHNFHDSGPPITFETMIFHNDDAGGFIPMKGCTESFFGYMRRYSTWEQALAGHYEVCQEVREGMKKGNPHANKRRMQALHERHYERLCSRKSSFPPRLRVVQSSGPSEAMPGSA